MIRLLLVDDQQLVREGLRRILHPDEGFEIVGECADGAAALEAAARLDVDVVVMDIRMKGMDGVEATRRLRERPDAPPVLVLTTFDDDDVLSGALRAGAAGFVLKDAPGEELIRSARAIAAGDAWLDQSVTARVLATYRSASPASAEVREQIEQLTTRELDVLRLVGRGATNAEIADRAHRQRSDGEEPHRAHLHQARPAGSGGGNRVRLRPRPRRAPHRHLTPKTWG